MKTSAQDSASPPRRWRPLVLRLVVLGVVGWWVTQSTDLNDFGAVLTRLPVLIGGAALAIALGNMVLAGLRWRALMVAFGARDLPPVLTLVRLFLIGQFYNTFVPGSVGGDVVRGAVSRACFDSGATSYAVVVSERLLGLSALGLIFLFGFAAGPSIVDLGEIWPWIVAVIALGIGVLVAGRLGHRLTRIWAQIPRIVAPRSVVTAFVISLFGHGLTLIIFWCLAEGLELNLSFAAIALVVPLGLVASIVPIAIAGIGPREAALVGLLGMLGVARESALALSLTFAAILIALAAVGGLLQLGWGLSLETDEGEADAGTIEESSSDEPPAR